MRINKKGGRCGERLRTRAGGGESVKRLGGSGEGDT